MGHGLRMKEALKIINRKRNKEGKRCPVKKRRVKSTKEKEEESEYEEEENESHKESISESMGPESPMYKNLGRELYKRRELMCPICSKMV